MDVPIQDLPAPLEGFRIAHISDLHIGDGSWRPAHVAEAARLVQSANPDVVINTGDYVQGHIAGEVVCRASKRFVAPNQGRATALVNIAILGNHDYWEGMESANRIAGWLESSGVRVLTNEAVCIEHHGSGVSFVGLTLEQPGFDEGVRQMLLSSHPRIVLVHEPDLVERLPFESADLILSGHTHGGQITVPGLESLIVRLGCGSRYVAGRYRVKGMLMYVNRGLGHTGIPIRFRVRPEVTILRLIRKDVRTEPGTVDNRHA